MIVPALKNFSGFEAYDWQWHIRKAVEEGHLGGRSLSNSCRGSSSFSFSGQSQNNRDNRPIEGCHIETFDFTSRLLSQKGISVYSKRAPPQDLKGAVLKSFPGAIQLGPHPYFYLHGIRSCQSWYLGPPSNIIYFFS